MTDVTIEPKEVHAMMQDGTKFFLLDCREPWEFETARIDGAKSIPMRQIPQRVQDLPNDQLVVVYCHTGMRSFNAASWLNRQGVTAYSMNGGIDQWSREIDPKVPRY